VAVDLLQFAGVPARVVNGVALAPERRNAQFTHWIEYYAEHRWHTLYTIDAPAPDRGQQYLPWWRGQVPFIALTGGQDALHTITISRSYEYSIRTALSQ
jgi:hypothetical protein